MATQTGQIPFTGRIGNLIGYKRNGVHFLRSMPTEVIQSKASRKAARNFGIASSNGSLVRKGLGAHLDVRGDGAKVNRLNKTLIQSGIQGMKGFRFNKHTGLDQFFCIAPTLSENNIMRIPAQTLFAPYQSTSIEVKLISSRIDFSTRRIINSTSHTITLDPGQPFEGLEMDASVQGKGSLIVAIQIRVYFGNMLTLDRRFNAADIIAVVVPVVVHASKKISKKPVKQWQPSVQKPIPATTSYTITKLIKADLLE